MGVRYNDRSVLENMHVALTFETMQQDDECDWFSLLSGSTAEPASSASREKGTGLSKLQQYVRKGIISLVLATDMAKHSQHVQALNAFVADESDYTHDHPPSPAAHDKQKALERTLFLLETVLHASDISNPCKPRRISLGWTKRMLTEFWAQGDEERELGLDISPLCDREPGQKDVPKGQIGFINFVVLPLYKPIAEFIQEAQTALENLQLNKAFWEEKDQDQTPFEEILRIEGAVEAPVL